MIRHLAEARESTSPFRYLESHAGKGEYSLESSQDWRHGIGHALASIPTTQRDFYLDTEAKAVAKASYLGSWRLVSEYFTHHSIPHTLELHDNDPIVVESARLTAANDRSIVVKRMDGFEAARDSEADLIFIDPFTAWPESENIAKSLQARHFLLWYPIFHSDQPNNLVSASGLAGCEVLWRQIHRNVSRIMRGCGLLFSSTLSPHLAGLFGELFSFAGALQWQFHLRIP